MITEYSVAILCGGHSTRMGEDKSLMDWHGQPMILHLLEGYRDCRDIILSVHHEQKLEDVLPVDSRITIVEDRREDYGPMEGLRSSLAAAKNDLVFVTTCDAPYVDAKVADFLAAAIRRGRGQENPGRRNVRQDERQADHGQRNVRQDERQADHGQRNARQDKWPADYGQRNVRQDENQADRGHERSRTQSGSKLPIHENDAVVASDMSGNGLAGYEYDAVIPRTQDGKIHPLVAVYRKCILPEVQEQIREGNHRMTRLLDRLRVKYISAELLPGGEHVLTNLNTPQDREAAGSTCHT